MVENYGQVEWESILQKADQAGLKFSPLKQYPDEVLTALLGACCEHLRVEPDEALFEVGKFAAPQLVRFARAMLHPDWKTFDLLTHLETLIHRTIRIGQADSAPPDIQGYQISDTEMQLVYSSQRKLCKLAKGILTSLGSVFSEELEISEDTCVMNGDAFCTFTVRKPERAPLPKEELHVPFESEKSVSDNSWEELSTSEIDLDFSIVDKHDSADERRTQRIDRTTMMGSSFEKCDLKSLLPPTVGRYRILEPIGQGGFGAVYKALDEELGRVVAIKTIKNVELENGYIELFVAESRQLAKLNHENVVKVFDVGRVGRRPYFVMEWLDGITLHKRLRNGTLPFELTKAIFLQLLDAIHAVHEVGIIHRDIKTANVMLSSSSTSCCLLDFGFASNFGKSLGTGVSGTPGYIAPEVVYGYPGDYRSDFFSLGVIGFIMFSGLTMSELISRNSSNKAFLQVLSETELWENLDQQVKEAIEGMLRISPAERLCDVKKINEMILNS